MLCGSRCIAVEGVNAVADGWGRKTSSNVQALMWCIGELGLPYGRHDAGHRYTGTDTPAFLKMSPNGIVPVLRDGDSEPLWKTGAILRYLAARYGSEPFWPADGLARAGIDKWAEWSKINVALNFSADLLAGRAHGPGGPGRGCDQPGGQRLLDKMLDIAEA